VRDNETAAAVMGVNLVADEGVRVRHLGRPVRPAGLGHAIRLGSVSPDIATLTMLGSMTFLIIMVIGGAGSLWGPIIGSAALRVRHRPHGWLGRRRERSPGCCARSSRGRRSRPVPASSR
jgi:ABC-type branched-subunit amino acid transport system permease subunit